MKTSALWLVAVFLMVGFGDALAETSSESRLQRLEDAVRVLEQRVAALEEQLRAAATPTAVAPGKANWRKLRNGMSEGEVEQLLGSPSRVDNMGPIVFWYYGYPVGGAVQFDGRNRTVKGWQEP